MCERELETEQDCNILTLTLLAITAFLSRSPGLLNRGSGGPASLGHVPQYSIFSAICLMSQLLNWGHEGSLCWVMAFSTVLVSNWTGLQTVLSYIIVQRPPSSCGHHKLHSFNPYTVKFIHWYSSTGHTCYLHRCISYFGSPLGR